ncbi:MAG: hypothetical protein HKN47_04145, partial [Pirellulaceae bacterium]|nr:hypothetical protein [Pirellulaceae bacterium]
MLLWFDTFQLIPRKKYSSMGYSGYSTPTPPRSIRVILGGKLALGCLLIGTMLLTNQYHRALTMGETAQEMEWEQLAENGLTNNSFICLTNVQLHDVSPKETLEELFGGLDPNADPE